MSSSPTRGAGVVAAREERLLGLLAQVPDPRDPRGVRYGLAGLLAVTVCAVLAGARSFAAVGQWAGDLSPGRLGRLGLDRAPVESTLRKLFTRLDGAALDAVLAVLAWTKTALVDGRRVIAIDGKTVRGARTGDKAAPHLVAALDHRTGVVLGQVQVEAKSNEIPALRDLLAGFDPADLQGCVITADAMHTQTDTATTVLAAGAHYVFTVKANQPGLLARLKHLPWEQVSAHSCTTTGHGRRTTRTLKTLQAPAWTGFTGAAQVAQLRRTVTKAGKKSVQVVYLITSADHLDAPPTVLASWVQDHWAIENRLHWVRDVTYDEDRSQVRTGSAPRVMATLRSTAISLLRLTGWTNIAAGLRHHSYDPDRPITCLLTC